jgi:hypothetical protein
MRQTLLQAAQYSVLFNVNKNQDADLITPDDLIGPTYRSQRSEAEEEQVALAIVNKIFNASIPCRTSPATSSSTSSATPRL